MNTTHLSPHPPISNQSNDDEIDIRQVTAALGRQKILIGTITVAATLLSSLYAFTRKSIWVGSFQIVLEKQSRNSGGGLAQLAAANPMLANMAGLGGGASETSLETEVKILESPSVLKPVYDLLRPAKLPLETMSVIGLHGLGRGNLSFELVKGTSVLNLAYKDTDKSLVLPVLERITKTYQEYSNRDNANSINNGLKFAVEQSEVLRAKAKDSNLKLDAFKFTYGISDVAGSVDATQLNKLSTPLPQATNGKTHLWN